MCRLLAVKSDQPFDIRPHIEAFADVARNSRQYQGHGWGCAWLDADGQWKIYHDLRPIWEDEWGRFGMTTLLLAHARSAFRDEGIDVKNNMPFFDGRHMFLFNGELHGVRIREEGRIGAEKVFNFIRRLDRGNLADALERGATIITKRSRFVRAMNIILADSTAFYVRSEFRNDPDYFTMHSRVSGSEIVICSDPYVDEEGWQSIERGRVRIFR